MNLGMKKSKGVILMGIGALTGYITATSVLAVNASGAERAKALKAAAALDDRASSFVADVTAARGDDSVSLSSAAQLTMNDVGAPNTTPNASPKDKSVSIIT